MGRHAVLIPAATVQGAGAGRGCEFATGLVRGWVGESESGRGLQRRAAVERDAESYNSHAGPNAHTHALAGAGGKETPTFLSALYSLSFMQDLATLQSAIIFTPNATNGASSCAARGAD